MMLQKFKNIKSHPRFAQATDIRNIGLYIFGVLVLVVSFNSVQVIQDNYELQKRIARLQQQNEVAQLENSNLALRNEYYQSEQYLELVARKQFGKAQPGETLVLVPKEIAKKYAKEPPKIQEKSSLEDQQPTYKKNLNDWRDFFFSGGRQ